ncbi:FGGY-family carbohydrate kinase [Kribbella lupini]|uniref:Carbohydrate kinase FGGY N-terminal domain-containing protein n=1 Tax=Kribbella lupini TaxID=291602 RepID=A0ABN2B5T6_9ACTN
MTFLGVDVGTTNTKVCLIPQGRSLGVPTPRDPAVLTAEVSRLIEQVSDGQRIDGVGIAGMAETGVPLGADLQPLTGLISWRDQPGIDQAQLLSRELGPQRFYARTGLRVSPKLPLTTWRWLADTSDVLDHTRIWAGAPDLILAALTGRYATHLTHAQRYGVLDLRRRTWDDELVGWGGLDRLPEIAEPMTVTAHTIDGPLPAGIPVVLCGHDHLVGAWAAGVREPGQVADSLGTSEAIITPSAGLVIDDELRRQGISVGWYADGRLATAVSGHGAAGGLIDERLAFLGRDYAWLGEALREVGPPSERVIAPYPNGRQAPRPDSTPTYDVRSVVDDPGEELRALVDGLSFHARWMAEAQTRLLGIEWRDTIAFGGPTRLEGWMRRKALAGGGRGFAVVAGEAVAAEGAALMAAEVVSGRRSEALKGNSVGILDALSRTWDGFYWDRFHKVVTAVG